MTRNLLCCLLAWSFLSPCFAAEPADLKKLSEAQQALKNAMAEVAKAEAGVAAAQGVAAKEESQQALLAAGRKLAEAQRQAAAQNTQVLNNAAGQATVVRGFPGYGGAAERENVDPQDPVERFALLTPGGPVVIETTITIDGQPFRTLREKLIEQMLVAADKDKDGKPTWDEALTSGRFTLGRLGVVANEQQRKSYIQNFDKNSDGLVDRSEVRQFLAQFFQGATFALGGSGGYAYGGQGGVVVVNGQMMWGGGAQADVRALLDSDSDGILSDKEIAAAGERLKSRDADDNDLLYPTEISGPAPVQGRVNVAQGASQPPQTAVLLGPTAMVDALHAALRERYKNAEGNIAAASFSAVPKLFATLDKNTDGILQKDEVLALNEVPPHVSLTVDLSAAAGKAQGLAIQSLAAEIAKTHVAADAIQLELPGVRVSITANLRAAQNYNFEQNAAAMLTRYDKDSNQYLEKSELPDQLGAQFEQWDADSDGKVYAAEIASSYSRMMAPQASQVAANVVSQGNSLFQTLDQTGDSRLSLREMRAASERIKTLDADKDQQITQGEIPATFSVTFALGSSLYGGYSAAIARPAGGQPAPAAGGRDAPEWFTRMDRNGDGDVTLKEFLGDEADFQKLDANADGFIEPKEAKAAK